MESELYKYYIYPTERKGQVELYMREIKETVMV